MKKILFVLALFATGTASAQTVENENLKAQREMEAKGYFGHAEYKMDKIHSYNINYTITPKVPTTKVNIQLSTSVEQPIGIYIANSQGKKMATMDVSESGHIKTGEINVSKLKAGKYNYVIHWDNDIVVEIPFVKK